MWYTLIIQCPNRIETNIRSVGVFLSSSTGFFHFNYCNFSNAVDHCDECEKMCKNYIIEHPGEPLTRGTFSHPLNLK